MREIKFRGKDCSGKWRYGAYIPTEFTQWQEPSIFDGHHRAEVDGETLGQFTGLFDSEGIAIYEGDIVKTKMFGKDDGNGHNWNDYDTFSVVFKDCAFKLSNSRREFFLATTRIDDLKYRELKVIGNMFENPELLEVKNDDTD